MVTIEMLSRLAITAVVLVWLHAAAETAGAPTCPTWARPDKMIVVNATPPYYSWTECTLLFVRLTSVAYLGVTTVHARGGCSDNSEVPCAVFGVL